MEKKSQESVVIITLNYNQNEYTLGCVESLLSSDYGNFQLFLIDNGSSEENYQKLKDSIPSDGRLFLFRIKDNCGYVGGINFGLKSASSYDPDFYLIMNNDTIIDEFAISELVDAGLRYDKKAIVSGKVYNYDEKDTLQYIGQDFDPEEMLNQKSIVKERREKDIGQYDSEREMGMLDDIFWLMPSSVYKTIGGYSDYFFLYGEQNDYAFRALKEGFKLIYTPQAKLWHKGGITTCGGEKTSARIEYWTTMAVLKLSVLHFPSHKAQKFYRKWLLRSLFKNVFLLLAGKNKPSNILAIVQAYLHFRHWNVIRYKDNGYNPF